MRTAREVGAAECRAGKITNASSDNWTRSSSSTATRRAATIIARPASGAAQARVAQGGGCPFCAVLKWRTSDEADNHLIELALAAQADVILTRNLRDVARGEL